MNSRETRRYDMFVRVQTFGTDNSADFAPTSTAATNFATVTTVVNGLGTAKAGQKPGARHQQGSSARRHPARPPEHHPHRRRD